MSSQDGRPGVTPRKHGRLQPPFVLRRASRRSSSSGERTGGLGDSVACSQPGMGGVGVTVGSAVGGVAGVGVWAAGGLDRGAGDAHAATKTSITSEFTVLA